MTEITWEEWSGNRSYKKLMNHRYERNSRGFLEFVGCLCYSLDSGTFFLHSKWIHDQILAINLGFSDCPEIDEEAQG